MSQEPSTGRPLRDAAVSLSLAAALTLAGFLVYHAREVRRTDPGVVSLKLADFRFLKGRGTVFPDRVEIEAPDASGVALVVGPASGVSAEEHPTARWRLEGSPVPRARVLWTTSGDLRLGGHPGWRGDLAVVGLLVRGPLPGPVVLRSLDLVPERLDGAELLPRLWKEWSAFEGWNVRSINFTAGGKRNGLFPPTLAASIWVTLAALIHVGLARTRRRPPSGVSLVAIFLAGWAVLDLRWQVDLARQLRLTHDQYAGKSGEEKRLTAADRPLYLFAKAVTRHLDAAPSRVFLVSEDLFGERYFRRVRTHYFLLPHNVSSLWTAVPQASQTRTGDYVLVMRPCGNVTFDPERGLLRTGDLPGLPVEPLLEEHEGLLFRVR